MKRLCITMLILTISFLSGCQEAQPLSVSEAAPERSPAAEAGRLEPLAADALSPEFRQTLEDGWAAWNRMGRETRMLSSRTPGYGRRNFDSWAEWEEFLGLAISNPLETCPWLEQGTYAGMPLLGYRDLGLRDAPRVRAHWYGTEGGCVEQVSASAGYRNGDVRVMLSAGLYGDPEDHPLSPVGEAFERERQAYLAEPEDVPAEIVSRRSERHYTNETYLIRGSVLYCLNIVGEAGAQEQVEDTMSRVLDLFAEAVPDSSAAAE